MPNDSAVTDIGVSPRSQWAGVGMLIACATLWSLNGPLIKLLAAQHGGSLGMDGAAIAFYRSLFGGLIMLPLGLRHVRTLRVARVGWSIGTVLCFTLMTLCFSVATTEGPAANAIILQYTSPLWVFALAPLLLRERIALTDGAALLLAMVGVAVIFAGHATSETKPLLIGLASGLGYGSLTVTLRGLRRVHPITVVALNFVGSAVLLAPVVWLWSGFEMTQRQFLLMLLMGVVQFALPYVMFTWALQRVEAYKAALIVLLEAVLNPLLTLLIAKEPIPGPTLIGGPLILASVVAWTLLAWRREQRIRRVAMRGIE